MWQTSVENYVSRSNMNEELQILKSVLIYTILFVLGPIFTFFISKLCIFDLLFFRNELASSVSSAICAVILVHVILGMFLYKACTYSTAHPRFVEKLELASYQDVVAAISLRKAIGTSDTSLPDEPLQKGAPEESLLSNPGHDGVDKIIDQLDVKFDEVIKMLESSEILGVSVEGVKISRIGKLALLAVTCKHGLFLFDIVSLGVEAFEKGLQRILEDKTIVKVFYDVRQASDCLYHLYNVNLTNVFDVQVAAMIDKASKDKIYRPESLSACIENYLGITLEQHRNREDKWLARPLSVECRQEAIQHVIYLRTLRTILIDQLLIKVNRGTDLYLHTLRDAKDEKEVRKALVSSSLAC